MTMRIVKEVSTRIVEGKGEADIPKSEIIVSEQPTGRLISGAILEAAVQCNGFYLLLMTDDTPFEEMLSIHLLDNRWNLLDSAVLGGIYSTGTFSAMKLEEPNLVHFRFIGETDWSVEVLTKPRFRFPFIPDVAGVKRDGGFRRYFIVHGRPYKTSK